MFMVRALLGLACCAALSAAAQTTPVCPQAAEVKHTHMLGFWRAEVDGRPGATLLLEPHPDYAGFRGAINRNGERRLVAGDVDDGGLTLEESADGKRISATWLGEVVDGSCGREIRGTWQAEGDKKPRPFVMKKMEGADRAGTP